MNVGHLLIVDDQRGFHESIEVQLLFSTRRIPLLHAYSGEEALKVYRAHPGEIALVLLDYVMPGMDGVAVFRELRKLDPEARVYMVSGHDCEPAFHLMKEGLLGYHSKGDLNGTNRLNALLKAHYWPFVDKNLTAKDLPAVKAGKKAEKSQKKRISEGVVP